MICPKCGTSYSDEEFKYCSSCGSKLVEELGPTKKTPVHTITPTTSNEKNVLLLVAAIIGLVYVAYLVFYFIRINGDAQSTGEAIGAGIAAILVMPHMICNVVAVIFNFIGWAKSKPSFALTAGILYAISAVLFITYTIFVLAQMILCFIGYSKLKSQTITVK